VTESAERVPRVAPSFETRRRAAPQDEASRRGEDAAPQDEVGDAARTAAPQDEVLALKVLMVRSAAEPRVSNHGHELRWQGLRRQTPSTRRPGCRVICPAGKISTPHQKPVQPRFEKYFAFSETQIRGMDCVSRPDKRGVSRSSRTRGGMQWTR
jgi:hypothetical protein